MHLLTRRTRVPIEGDNNYVLTKEGVLFCNGEPVYAILDAFEYPAWPMSICGSWMYYPCHRLMAETFLKKPTSYKGKLVVNHKDGNKKNWNLNNLEWITQSQNVIHANLTGLVKNRLPTHVVHTICAMITQGWENKRISMTTGVCPATICNIRHNRRYRSISQQYWT